MRTTSASAAAPNSKTIGGAGTGVGGPPFDPELLPEDEPDELEELDELLDPEPLAPELVELDPFDDQPPVDDELPVDDHPLLLEP